MFLECKKQKTKKKPKKKKPGSSGKNRKATIHDPDSPPGFVGVGVGMLVLVVDVDVVVVDDTIIVVDSFIPAFIASTIRLRLVVNTPVAVCCVRPELASAEAWSAHAI